MKLTLTWLLLVAVQADAQLQLVPASAPTTVFAGMARPLSLVWHNAGEQTVTAPIRAQIYQTTMATAVRLSDAPWKTLTVLAQQTVSETAALDFPAVKAETRFIVQWWENTNHLLGTTEIWVYPINLMAELKSLVGEDQAVGIFDPGNVLKPLLKSAKVEFEDLEDAGIASFRGRLAILGPFPHRQQMPTDLAERIGNLASKNVGVVWIQPPASPSARLKPSFYTLPSGTNAVVVVQASLLDQLADQPQPQFKLLQLCRLSQNPEPLTLLSSTIQP